MVQTEKLPANSTVGLARTLAWLPRPALLLRLEGAAVLLASILMYWRLGGSWLWFALFLLVPDLAAVGYLLGNTVGAAVYNLIHTYVWPIALALYGVFSGNPTFVLAALIWSSHIGMDRMVKYGLKYPTGFKETHLSRV